MTWKMKSIPDNLSILDLNYSGEEPCQRPCKEVTSLSESVAEIKRSNTLAQVAIGAIVSIALAAISYHTSTQIAQIQQGPSRVEIEKVSKQLDAILEKIK